MQTNTTMIFWISPTTKQCPHNLTERRNMPFGLKLISFTKIMRITSSIGSYLESTVIREQSLLVILVTKQDNEGDDQLTRCSFSSLFSGTYKTRYLFYWNNIESIYTRNHSASAVGDTAMLGEINICFHIVAVIWQHFHFDAYTYVSTRWSKKRMYLCFVMVMCYMSVYVPPKHTKRYSIAANGI